MKNVGNLTQFVADMYSKFAVQCSQFIVNYLSLIQSLVVAFLKDLYKCVYINSDF